MCEAMCNQYAACPRPLLLGKQVPEPFGNPDPGNPARLGAPQEVQQPIPASAHSQSSEHESHTLQDMQLLSTSPAAAAAALTPLECWLHSKT